MKKSELTFSEGFTCNRGAVAKSQGKSIKAFDWDKAAAIIKEALKDHPDLTAEAATF